MPWRREIEQTHLQRRGQNRWRQRQTLVSGQGRQVAIGDRRLLNFCSNDYLGLASHPVLAEAAIVATQACGTGSGASHLVCGHQDVHHRLEQNLAKLVNAEAAIVFSTGYMANLAVPQTFLGRNDLLLQDRLNHASLLDAGALAKTKMQRYAHCSVEEMTQRLVASDAGRKLVTTDGVFSMDGDVAPVKKLAAACQANDAMLLVDDAHGLGVLGLHGAGLLERENVPVKGNVLLIGTLGKAAGSFGAFIAGDAIYIQHLIQFARPYIYTTALPPAVAATSLKALELFSTEAWRRERLADLIKQFRERAEVANLTLMESSTAIQPLVLGSESNALAADEMLRANGVLGIAIRPPTVAVGSARIRLTLRADHTDGDLDHLFGVLASDAFRRLLEPDAGGNE